jgi:S1-C subfamily serine protease
VISAAARSVVFLQAGYGFVEKKSGKPLRLTASPDEKPDSAVGPISVSGTGPVVEILYTGTGFLVSSAGLLLTNRHVAIPWEYDPTAKMVVEEGFAPVMRRFRGFFAEEQSAFDVELLRVSDEADLALLRCAVGTQEAIPLELSPQTPQPGDEVIVLGYPAGMNALLARTDPAFANEMLAGGPIDFWVLAERLAAGGHIAPLATVGVIGQVTSASIVYDAETTHGGSGGPVLALDGKVVAVNTAIVPEFGGSNLGVPAARAAALMKPPSPATNEVRQSAD